MEFPVAVVGIGADGWDGLSASSRVLLVDADVVFGSARQLSSVRAHCRTTTAWPSPLLPHMRSMIDAYAGRRVCVLASGDPMFYGIGVTLVREFGADRLDIRPAPSSVSLACARLGWAMQHTATTSLVGSPVDSLLPELAHGRRLVVLSRGRHTPAEVAALLAGNGFGASAMTVLEQLGGVDERVQRATADEWAQPDRAHTDFDPLNVVALDCIRDSGTLRLTRVPGLPDASYSGDGQLTKQEVRALTLSALAPSPGELLWDIGGGSGSIAIEWMRTDSSCQAMTFETVESRRRQIEANASALGVPGLRVLGEAPREFPADVRPDAVFVGGGVTRPNILSSCWLALAPGGRMVANSVTAESDSILLDAAGRYGGVLRRFQIYRGESLGSFTAWRPHLPVTQWIATKP